MAKESQLNLHRPTMFKEILNTLKLRQIQPADIGNPDELYRQYRDLYGDQTAIGPGDDGDCPSWVNDWEWHTKLLKQHGIK